MGDFQTTMQTLNKSGIINYNDVPVTTKSGRHIDTDIYLVDRQGWYNVIFVTSPTASRRKKRFMHLFAEKESSLGNYITG